VTRSTAEKTSRTTIIFADIFAEPPHFAGVIPNLDIDVAELLRGGFQRGFVGWRDDFLARSHAVVFIDLIDTVIWHGVPFREQRSAAGTLAHGAMPEPVELDARDSGTRINY